MIKNIEEVMRIEIFPFNKSKSMFLSMRNRTEEIYVVFISRQDNEKSLDSILKLSIQFFQVYFLKVETNSESSKVYCRNCLLNQKYTFINLLLTVM